MGFAHQRMTSDPQFVGTAHPTPMSESNLHSIASALAQTLERTNHRIVFAESCTGGLVVAVLTRVPGISRFLCGSAVVYQVETKQAWLGVPADLLDDPGPVSEEVAGEMAARALGGTPQATIAVSVTGHLGPNAPAGQDGLVYIGVAQRVGDGADETADVQVVELRLPAESGESSPTEMRVERQQKVAAFVLETARDAIDRR